MSKNAIGPLFQKIRERLNVELTILLAAALLVGGCTSLPRNVERTQSHPIADYAETDLYRMTAEVVPPTDGRSGFRLLPIASAAYETRIELTRLAQKTLDVQYYYFPGDNVGRYMMRALRNAAERGVHVRLLIDDLYTAGEDSLLLALASYPNVEVRLFNPFPGGRGSEATRFLNSALDFGRVNHRMHNKLFVADNAAAVFGGRNMGDEYFMRSNGANFVDIDAFAAGPVVRDLSAVFDRYWNSQYVYPIQSIAVLPLSVELRRREFDALTVNTVAPPPDDSPASLAVFLSLPAELRTHHLQSLILAHGHALGDPVDKAGGANMSSLDGTVTSAVLQLLSSAKKEIVVVSPYFVPGELGLASMRRNEARGVRELVLTNSLASTDEPIVYIGYTRYRKQMLEAGVEIRELSPSLAVRRQRLGNFGKSSAGLHAKLAIVDRSKVFVGSMNLDERSAYENTETGVIIESAEFAEQVLGLIDNGSGYLLRLSPEGNVEWIENDGDKEIVFDSEPEVSPWLKWKLFLLAPFVSDKEL